MDLLENVMNAVGSAAQNVVKKSGEVVGYSKLKYTIYDVKNSIKDLEAEIGKAVYKSYKDETPLNETVKEKCEEIDKLSEQLKEYNEQLENFKSVIKCPSCGKSVKDSCSYCPSCGTKLAEDKEAEFCSGSDGYCTPPKSEPVDDEPTDETTGA